MSERYIVYGAAGSGSVPVEAVLTLCGADYEVIERPTWEGGAIADDVGRVNPLRQIPAVLLPSGELMTESAALLIHLTERFPDAGLAPAADSPLRPRFLRWTAFIATQIYSLYWVRDEPSRLAEGETAEAVIEARTRERIAACWRLMEAQVTPEGRFMLGERLSALDLYMAVVSRFRPGRTRFYAEAPRMAEVVRAVDAEPSLRAFWAARYPFDDGWAC